ncbi:MAG: guanylate kinase [Chlorobia bacterium]|nr:guanylate kinase [Fimbriimonadaceae bacterium]
MSGHLVILSGPSGVGKDTVIDAWREVNPKVQRVVAYTTRSPRDGETDGRDYHFVTVDEFKALAAEGAFLEHKEVHGNYYATPLRDMEAMLDEGRIAVLKIDVQGALTAMALRPDALTAILLPPSWDVLEQRIRGRGTEDAASINKRLANARAEMEFADRYQHQIVNDDLETVVARLEAVVA